MQALPPSNSGSISPSPVVGPARINATATQDQVDSRLAKARLGSYSGLFQALRAKHPPTAAHCLRVALACSRWAAKHGLGEVARDRLEIAALLHDIGKIGIPDSVIQKPSQLTVDEQLMMQMHVDIAEEILCGCGTDPEIVSIVQHASRSGHSRSDQELLPESKMLAQMLAITDAFDSMTTEQVFRKAMSRETAINELFACGHTDNALVAEYSEMVVQSTPELDGAVANRWLKELIPEDVAGFASIDCSRACGAHQSIIDSVFQPRLMDAMSDAAIYLDASKQILLWNRAAEHLTGHRAASTVNRSWDPTIVGLADESGSPIDETRCPLAEMRRTNTRTTARLTLTHSSGKTIAVSVTALPVFTGEGAYCGAILLIRDASTEANLEQRVESLHKIATSDPLTKASNRVELDRRLPEIIQHHQATSDAASLMICDIDFFKKINDTYGHQAGDDALVTFAGILKEKARSTDIVARFGGEEFVIVCPDCDNASATDRAEEIRRAVERTPVPALDGRTMTASFGVTELLIGDTPDVWLARADRALMEAKESGRNRVIQVGTGMNDSDVHAPLTEAEIESANNDASNEARDSGSWFSWFSSKDEQKLLLSTELLAAVPSDLAVQKLAGFVADYAAEIVQAEEHLVAIKIDMSHSKFGQRSGERPALLLLQIDIIPVEYRNAKGSGYQSRTKLKVEIHMLKARDRRREALRSQAGQLLASFQSYLVTQVINEELAKNINEPR